ncbi:hypothetical protein [Alkalisalibacterium limincola]|uniref:O-linked N-acetylglucosamine transferase family protein n=1 Tax=Alkalisalibacterium limincola TaxID=2699169 RepID=UPI00164F75B5|nr:hypothetical protein [Alkalisalibacterium limincola]
MIPANCCCCRVWPPASTPRAWRVATCSSTPSATRGGASGIGAVAAGLPVLALAGDRPLARMGAGLSAFLGLDELVCPTMQAYIDTAVDLATDAQRRRDVRRRLDEAVRRTGLFDPRRIASALEDVAGA